MVFAIPIQNLLLSDIAAFSAGAFAAALIGRRIGLGRERLCQPDVTAALVEHSPDALMRVDSNLVCTLASPAVARVFGQAPADLVGRSLADLAGADADGMAAGAARARAGTKGVEVVFRATHPTREQIWVEARFGVLDADGCIVVALRDVSTRKTAELALRVANLELNRLAGSDGLTDLANRRRFDQALETECRRAARNEKPVTLLLLDVDRFKAYNDCYGHQAGDTCLKDISGALKTALTQTTELAARFGGEEFALLLPGVDAREGAALAEQVRAKVAALRIPHTGNVECGGTVTVSVGCATVRPTPDSFRGDGAVLIAGADRALYDAKRLGRDRVVAPALIHEEGSAVERLNTDQERLSRLDQLRSTGALQPTVNLDRIARMAAVLLGMPVACVAMLDREKAMTVGHYGMGDAPLPMPHGFCAHLLGARGAVVIPDMTIDPRFQAFAADHGLAFFAAAPLLSGDDLQHVGALWVFDRQARGPLDEPKRMLLSRLAALVMEDLDSRVMLEMVRVA